MNSQRQETGNSFPNLGRFHWRSYLGVMLSMSLLYGLTAQRGVSWQDSGRYQWRVLTGDYRVEGGLALAHPLYIACSQVVRMVPFGDLALRLNVLSGIWMSLALANLAAVAALLTGRWWVAVLTAAMLGLAHTPWWLATIAETYPMSAAALTAELWLLVLLIHRPWWGYLVGLALAAGLHWSVHNLGLLAAPVYLAVAVWMVWTRRLPGWSLATAAGAYLAGAGPLLWLIIQEAARTGDAAGAIHSALFGDYAAAVLNTNLSGGVLWANAAISAMNLASWLLVLAVVGWAVMPRRLRRPMWLAILAITAIQIVFVARYNIPDQFTFLLPSLMMLGVAAAVGAGWLADRWPSRRRLIAVLWGVCIALQPVVLAEAPGLAQWVRPGAARAVQRPFRDERRYWLTPWKHDEHSAQSYAQAALKQAGPDGIILADSTARYPLLAYQQLHGVAPRVEVQHRGRPLPANGDLQAILQAAAGRPIYLTRREASALSARLASWGPLVPQGVLVRWAGPGREQSVSTRQGSQYNSDGYHDPLVRNNVD